MRGDHPPQYNRNVTTVAILPTDTRLLHYAPVERPPQSAQEEFRRWALEQELSEPLPAFAEILGAEVAARYGVRPPRELSREELEREVTLKMAEADWRQQQEAREAAVRNAAYWADQTRIQADYDERLSVLEALIRYKPQVIREALGLEPEPCREYCCRG